MTLHNLHTNRTVKIEKQTTGRTAVWIAFIIWYVATELNDNLDISYTHTLRNQYIVGCEKRSHVATIVHAWKHDGQSGKDVALGMFYQKDGDYGGTQCWGRDHVDFLQVTQVGIVILPYTGNDTVQMVLSEVVDSWGKTYHTISNQPIQVTYLSFGELVED